MKDRRQTVSRLRRGPARAAHLWHPRGGIRQPRGGTISGTAGGAAFGAGTALAAAAIGSLASRRAPKIYGRLRKPRWAPPPGAFGPVWTVLYAAIGVAGNRLWNRRAGRAVLGLHVAQLALNAAWPVTFFSARNQSAALGVIAALDGVVAAEIVTAARRDPIAAGLLAPYLAWSLFATALTATVDDPAGT